MQPFLDICQSDFTPPGFVLFCSVMCIHKCVHSLVICINLHSFQIHTCSKQIKFASERTRNIAHYNGKYLFYICFRVFVESIFPFIVTLSVTVVLRSILKYCVCVVLKYVSRFRDACFFSSIFGIAESHTLFVCVFVQFPNDASKLECQNLTVILFFSSSLSFSTFYCPLAILLWKIYVWIETFNLQCFRFVQKSSKWLRTAGDEDSEWH